MSQTTLSSLTSRLQRAEKVVSYTDPTDPKTSINFTVRALTPDEVSSLNYATLGLEDKRSITSLIVEKAKTEEGKVDPSEVIDIIADKLNLPHVADDRMLRTIKTGIIKIEEVVDGTASEVDISDLDTYILAKWNPTLLDGLFNAINDELPLENDLKVFPVEPETAETTAVSEPETSEHSETPVVEVVDSTEAPESEFTSVEELQSMTE